MMAKAVPRVYADTSVFGGVLDKEFKFPSIRFFEMIREGAFRLVVSDIVRRELADAPQKVKKLLGEMLPESDIALINEEALLLRDAYISSGILSHRWLNDALHVAVAVVNECSMIVSWNFKHIVHYEKIPLYNAVNALHKYGSISIYSPLEVIGHERPE